MWGTTKRRARCGSKITGAGKSLVTRLPAKAGDTLAVDTVLLVVSLMVAGETECFFRSGIANGEMVEFLKEMDSFKAIESVNKVCFLFIDNMI